MSIEEFLQNCVALNEVETYIEGVRSRAPHGYESYGYMHTWLCINLQVHPQDWLCDWERELGLL